MDVRACVRSAGRAVLDMVEREWQQPLSAGELEQRLDQAVEEILEGELMAELRAQPPPPSQQPPAGPQVPHTATTTLAAAACGPLEEEEEETPESQVMDAEDSAAVKTILLSLTLLCERVSYRSVSRRFLLEKGNIHRIFFSFCQRVNMLAEKQIRWPVGEEAVDALFPLLSPEKGREDEEQSVPRVLGVLGHARIPIRLPIGKHDVESTVPEVKRMKKEAHPDSWLNLELVCDRRGRFLHCRISRGSDVDRGIALRDKLKQHPELMPPGSCLVARAGYPLTAHILTPYVAASHGPREELFNKTLGEHFHILDQALARLRARFLRLRYLDIGNYDRARAVVLTACVLHNVFVDMGQVVREEEGVEKEEAVNQEGQEEEEEDEEGVHRRVAISDWLFKSFESGSTCDDVRTGVHSYVR
ncbi:hypothetical protein F2P81_015298 [Scophthalmus maximus]|uniref:DDE Tnp4 domain-containing protein n=1 Tax=Scophthalmus maximus TaxID=52904 RepID=A0A6A4SLF4_SCOMX|nr:hypothetical protein F2P81_015298 [Scophthalmus maximus]